VGNSPFNKKRENYNYKATPESGIFTVAIISRDMAIDFQTLWANGDML